ncbi:hypothetical protein ACHAWC_006948 [Mediolabrus comicus]
MRVLPAAILGLLSAASSVLPSAAIDKSASNADRRKLSNKADKSSDCPAENIELQEKLEFAIKLTSVATSLFAIADSDNSGTINLAEKSILQDWNPQLEGDVTFEELVSALNELYAGGACGCIDNLHDAIFKSLQLTLAVDGVQQIEDEASA